MYISLLEKAMATNSGTLAWKIPWIGELGKLQAVGLLRLGHDWTTSLSLFTLCTGEGNGNPLQCFCLEYPRDGEPGGLLSMGLHRVGHNWSDIAAAAAAYLLFYPIIMQVISQSYTKTFKSCFYGSTSMHLISFSFFLSLSFLPPFFPLFFYLFPLSVPLFLSSSYVSHVAFSSVQSLSHVRLFETPWTAACQASLSIINSRSLCKLMSIKLVM